MSTRTDPCCSERGISGTPRFIGVEALESRTLLAAAYPFAAVGVNFDPGAPEFYYSVGSVAANGAVTGTTFGATLGNTAASRPIDWATFLRTSPGKLNATTINGVDPYLSQIGGQFGTSDGFQPGFLSGVRDGGMDPDAADVAYFVETASDPNSIVAFTYSQGFTFRMLRQTAAGLSVVDGAFYINQARTTVRWVVGSTDLEQGANKRVTSLGQDGSITLESGEHIFFTKGAVQYADNVTHEIVVSAGYTCIVSDTNGADGDLGIGIGSPGSGVTSNASPLSATYRAAFITSGPVGAAALGASNVASTLGVANVVIELGLRGEYSLYSAAAYDAGPATPISTGTWTAPQGATTTFPTDRAGTVKLTDATSGRVIVLGVNSTFALSGAEVYDSGSTAPEPFVGQATSFVGLDHEATTVTQEVTLDGQGRPIYHEFDQTAGIYGSVPFQYEWFSRDLIELAGGKALSSVNSWRNYNYNGQPAATVVLGIATDGDVLLWEQMFQGRWRFRNLTTELSGEKITGSSSTFKLSSGPEVYFSFAGGVAAAGYTASGDLAIYRTKLYGPNELPPPNPYNVAAWSFTNITDSDLTPHGEATPQYAGGFTGYGTAWNGTNIAGLNSSGEIVVVWTAPDAGRWYVHNLSQLAATPALVGPLSPYQSDYNSLHISGVDSAGHVIVTWWTPAISGTWFHDDLTAEIGGPALTQAVTRGLVSFQGNSSSHNIAGYDAAGNLQVYWWTPYVGAPWQVGNVSSSIPEADRPHTLTSGASYYAYSDSTAYATVQEIFGRKSDGSLVRVYWTQSATDAWRFQDIAAEETTLPPA